MERQIDILRTLSPISRAVASTTPFVVEGRMEGEVGETMVPSLVTPMKLEVENSSMYV